MEELKPEELEKLSKKDSSLFLMYIDEYTHFDSVSIGKLLELGKQKSNELLNTINQKKVKPVHVEKVDVFELPAYMGRCPECNEQVFYTWKVCPACVIGLDWSEIQKGEENANPET